MIDPASSAGGIQQALQSVKTAAQQEQAAATLAREARSGAEEQARGESGAPSSTDPNRGTRVDVSA